MRGARLLPPVRPLPAGMLAHAVLHAPGFTLRGGTNEILRGIARGSRRDHGTFGEGGQAGA